MASPVAVPELTPQEVVQKLDAKVPIKLIDTREAHELVCGKIPGAVWIPRLALESDLPEIAAADDQIVVFCEAGARSKIAAQRLLAAGWRRVASMSGGFNEWVDQGFPVEGAGALSFDERARYRRHLVMPEVGEHGQRRLLDSKVCIVGLGGLGSPVALYLAAAGVGTLGLIDMDVVDVSNLQRQIVHNTTRVGMPKTESACAAIKELNPAVKLMPVEARLTRDNVLDVIKDYDVIVNGCDNFPTRYLLNDACIILKKPNVDAAVLGFDGHVTVYLPGVGPCYRCLFPTPPPPELAPSCSAAGVLGVLPGVIGALQATEVLKLLLGQGEPLAGRLLMFDALRAEFRTVKLKRDPRCPTCSEGANVELIDYNEFCSAAR